MKRDLEQDVRETIIACGGVSGEQAKMQLVDARVPGIAQLGVQGTAIASCLVSL